jgi:hypothetical protein
MNLTISKSLGKDVRKHAQSRGVTQAEYVCTALKQTIEAENDMAAEMRLWDDASAKDFARFTQARDL